MDRNYTSLLLALLPLLCLLHGERASAITVTSGTGDGSELWGYVDVRPKANLFWWFIRSPQRVSSPSKPWPTVLWLQGGPGGSSVGRGNFQEIGPLDVELKPRNSTWLQKADLIFVDHPVGVGYSYTDDPSALATTDLQAARDAFQLIKALRNKIPTLKSSPLYIVGESYGGKLASLIGVSLAKAIQAGDLKLTLGGVVIGDGWISPADFTLTYARLLYDVSRLDDNAVDDANKMAKKVSEQSAAGQFSASLQTFTDLLDLIDSKSGSVNMFNFLSNAGMDRVATQDKLKVRSSLLRRYVGPEVSGSSDPNSISDIMNGVIKQKLNIIPKNIVWQPVSFAVYDALENDFMKPAINEVDELLSLGVNVTMYNGQFDAICSSIGTEEWLKKLNWDGLNDFFGLQRKPQYFCGPYEYTSAFMRAYKNLQYYWILGAGHVVPADQPCVALHMIGAIMHSIDI